MRATRVREVSHGPRRDDHRGAFDDLDDLDE